MPIVLSCAAWGPQLSRCIVLFQCDNSSVVAAVTKALRRKPMQCICLDVCGFSQYIMIYQYSVNTLFVSQTTWQTISLVATYDLSFTRTHKPFQPQQQCLHHFNSFWHCQGEIGDHKLLGSCLILPSRQFSETMLPT